MRMLFLAFLLSLGSARAETLPPSLAGHWQFYKKIYHGQDMPEDPGATLRLHYEFSSTGESHLYWWHEGEGDHCSRRGKYSLDGAFLVEEVVWVDPQNTSGCESDPDMQPNRRTRTPFYFKGADFVLQFMIGEEALDIVWKRITEGK